jgi:SAM-dependent methyltransferase
LTEPVTQRVVDRVKPLVPLGVKRRVKGAIPRRFYKYVDHDWHRRTIGNVHLWDELGPLQLEYLKEQGLEPGHYVLDVGCGPLRAGVHLMRYLEPGHYYGIEKDPDVLELAREIELPRYGVADREPHLLANELFEFGRFGRKFDYAIAQSVFTHLPLNNIIRCLMEMEKALVEGGRFYATFFENSNGKRNLADVRQTETVVTHFDADFFHYDFATFEWICEGTKLRPEYIGDWGHPRNQKMAVFTRLPGEADPAPRPS